ncbi:hypothetical protein GJAV_G00055120 [Gymnothorax javanicus]|nr:hypothetical protein GJAV_G00055120 [Gymnothorax javanicus]
MPESLSQGNGLSKTKRENNPSTNIVSVISLFADDHLTIVRNISTGLAIAGIIVLARSIRLVTKFGAASEIPARFIEKNVSLRGRVHRVTENGLEVEHLPIKIPILSPLLEKRQTDALLDVRLAGVELTEEGWAWLKQHLSAKETVWFQLIRREAQALDCLVSVSRGSILNRSVNEQLLRLGLGRTVPLLGLHHESRLYWRLHKRLLKAEVRAERKGKECETLLQPPSHIVPATMSARLADQQGSMQYCRHFLADNSVFHVERCMSVMQSGTQMVKLKNGSKGLVRLFYLDEHRSCIRWRPSRKSEKAKITIDSLYKVCEGRQSDIFHRHAEGNFDPSCCFTIYHGNHMESLDLVTTKPEEARTWVTGLSSKTDMRCTNIILGHHLAYCLRPLHKQAFSPNWVPFRTVFTLFC